MPIRKYISFLVLFWTTQLLYAQKTTHDYLGTASGASDITGFGNISWSIGEAIVFNQQSNSVLFNIGQGLQAYPNIPKVDNCPTIAITSNAEPLCGITNAFLKTLQYSTTFPAAGQTPISVQWYYSETGGSSANVSNNFFKIAGANSLTQTSYQPFFPGYYAVCLEYTDCQKCSEPIAVAKASHEVINSPEITASGSPASSLNATPFTGNGFLTPILQWYVYVESVKKYLLVAGGNNNELKVRYDGDYMVMATYAGGCRLSSVYTVSGYNFPIQRASDVRIEGNSIYIPDETADIESSLKIYPNPANSHFYVHYRPSTENASNAGLYSNTGTLMKEISFNEGSTWSKTAKVNIEDLSAGVYFIRIVEDQKHLIQKIVIYK